jgi:peptidoglycan hydrolase-like protein with peptidoglycan-binding domain
MHRPTSSWQGRLTSRLLVGLAIGSAMFTVACSSDAPNSVDAAQKVVTAKQSAVDAANKAFTDAQAAFCESSKTYITAVDQYGKLFDTSAVTVGDVKNAGADLVKPRETVQASADKVVTARDDVAKAEKELADAEAALAAAQSSGSSKAPTSTSTTTTAPLVPPATVDRVKKAEDDLAAAQKGITDQTPLVQATAQYNAAAFSLQVAWLRLFADAGCLTDQQQIDAETAVRDYTVALQNALHTAGYYEGEVDGVYGPTTVDAVEQLQTAAGLTVTGLVDKATGAALDAAVAAKGGAVAATVLTHTASVQSTLKLAGYWTGPVDGVWTPELTDALKEFQTALGVPATGAVDAATLAALEQAIADAKSAATTTTEQSSSSSEATTTTTTSK